MKSYFLLIVLLGLSLTGCDSLSDARDTLHEKFNAREEPRVRVFAADQRATYEAAKIAAEQLDFRFRRGGPAQGELEAVSNLTAGNSLSTTRQLAMKVRLAAAPAGGTEVSLLLTEIIEGDADKGAGQGVGSPLRGTG